MKPNKEFNTVTVDLTAIGFGGKVSVDDTELHGIQRISITSDLDS